MSTTSAMPTTAGFALDFPPPPYPIRKFSVEEYFKLVDMGLLDEDDNCELLEGWIVPKMVKKPPHDGTIDIVSTRLSKLLPDGWYVRVQNVLQTATSAPEPDLVVTRGECDSFTERHPQGTDVGLVIEVADTSLQIDRRKAQIYAPAGVPQYWIINLADRCVEVFENPQPTIEGVRYAVPRILSGADELELVLDGQHVARISVAKLLPGG